MYVLKNGLFLARSLAKFAIGLLICFISKTPNFTTGKAPTTILIVDFVYVYQIISSFIKESQRIYDSNFNLKMCFIVTTVTVVIKVNKHPM